MAKLQKGACLKTSFIHGENLVVHYYLHSYIAVRLRHWRHLLNAAITCFDHAYGCTCCPLVYMSISQQTDMTSDLKAFGRDSNYTSVELGRISLTRRQLAMRTGRTAASDKYSRMNRLALRGFSLADQCRVSRPVEDRAMSTTGCCGCSRPTCARCSTKSATLSVNDNQGALLFILTSSDRTICTIS